MEIYTQNNTKNVVVGLSGGVDSAVCCKLLLNKGYNVTGLFLIMSDVHLKSLESAKKVASELNIPFITKDLRKQFKEQIILPFMNVYCNGATPNPCLICNELLKFKTLIETADELSYPYIATGHYAKISTLNSFHILTKSNDRKKDQSYMLYRLGQEVLSRLLLPIGEYSKEEIREIAHNENISAYNSADSQEICFIEDERYTSYMHRNGYFGKEGNFILSSGETVGKHKGVEYYTVGQRKGLSVNLGKPYYVRRILENGNILLEETNEADISMIIATDIKLNPYFDFNNNNTYTCKIRYQSKYEDIIVKHDKEKLIIGFKKSIKAPALGQSAVIYSEDSVVGGGIISEIVY